MIKHRTTVGGALRVCRCNTRGTYGRCETAAKNKPFCTILLKPSMVFVLLVLAFCSWTLITLTLKLSALSLSLSLSLSLALSIFLSFSLFLSLYLSTSPLLASNLHHITISKSNIIYYSSNRIHNTIMLFKF